MPAYYNENNEDAAAWLRELIDLGLIADGFVDERSILDVKASDLDGYTQAHFFAGIGGWPLALRLAGWPDDRPVWTGSCPCQPFSAAGRRKGAEDERHLWPVFRELIESCSPPVVFGEQVASSEVVGTQFEASFVVAVQSGDFAKANKIAKQLVATKGFNATPRWIDGVRADLEAAGYASWFSVFGAHSVGSPNIRQRLYWVADADSRRCGQARCSQSSSGSNGIVGNGRHCGLADAERDAAESRRSSDGPGSCNEAAGARPSIESGRRGVLGGVGDSIGSRLEGYAGDERDGSESRRDDSVETGSAATTGVFGFWSDFELIPCRDGKSRRIEPGSFPLAYGLPADLEQVWIQGNVGKKPPKTYLHRAALLRGYGNAIVPQVAAEFIKAYCEHRGELTGEGAIENAR